MIQLREFPKREESNDKEYLYSWRKHSIHTQDSVHVSTFCCMLWNCHSNSYSQHIFKKPRVNFWGFQHTWKFSIFKRRKRRNRYRDTVYTSFCMHSPHLSTSWVKFSLLLYFIHEWASEKGQMLGNTGAWKFQRRKLSFASLFQQESFVFVSD